MRSGPFEGPAIVKPPALPGDSYLAGLRQATGEYIALLNNDTEPDKEWLGELVRAMDNCPDVGICASKLIVYGTDIIDSAGDGFSTSLKGFKRGGGGENIFI